MDTHKEELEDTLVDLHQFLRELPHETPKVVEMKRRYYMGLIKEVLNDSDLINDNISRSP